jgi:hypothetical protein
MYDFCCTVDFDVVFIEGSGFWGPVVYCLGSVSVVGVGRAIVAFVFIDDSIVVGFGFGFFEFVSLRFGSDQGRVLF